MPNGAISNIHYKRFFSVKTKRYKQNSKYVFGSGEELKIYYITTY